MKLCKDLQGKHHGMAPQQRSEGLLAQVSGGLARENHSTSCLCRGLYGKGAKGSRELAVSKVALACDCNVFMHQGLASLVVKIR